MESILIKKINKKKLIQNEKWKIIEDHKLLKNKYKKLNIDKNINIDVKYLDDNDKEILMKDLIYDENIPNKMILKHYKKFVSNSLEKKYGANIDLINNFNNGLIYFQKKSIEKDKYSIKIDLLDYLDELNFLDQNNSSEDLKLDESIIKLKNKNRNKKELLNNVTLNDISFNKSINIQKEKTKIINVTSNCFRFINICPNDITYLTQLFKINNLENSKFRELKNSEKDLKNCYFEKFDKFDIYKFNKFKKEYLFKNKKFNTIHKDDIFELELSIIDKNELFYYPNQDNIYIFDSNNIVINYKNSKFYDNKTCKTIFHSSIYNNLLIEYDEKMKRGSYNVLTSDIKYIIIEHSKIRNIDEVSEFFNIDKKNIIRWMENGHLRKRGGGRKTTDPEMEFNLLVYIKGIYKVFHHIVDKKTIETMGKIFSKCPLFKASKGWYDKFFIRNINFFKFMLNENFNDIDNFNYNKEEENYEDDNDSYKFVEFINMKIIEKNIFIYIEEYDYFIKIKINDNSMKKTIWNKINVNDYIKYKKINFNDMVISLKNKIMEFNNINSFIIGCESAEKTFNTLNEDIQNNPKNNLNYYFSDIDYNFYKESINNKKIIVAKNNCDNFNEYEVRNVNKDMILSKFQNSFLINHFEDENRENNLSKSFINNSFLNNSVLNNNNKNKSNDNFLNNNNKSVLERTFLSNFKLENKEEVQENLERYDNGIIL